MPASPKQGAIQALMLAAFDCPSRINQEAFWEYQNNVMEPLRESIRNAAASELRTR